MNSAGSTSSISNNDDDPEGQKTNRSSSMRKKHTNLEKVSMLELCERVARGTTVTEQMCENRVGRDFEKCLGKSKAGWRNDNNKKHHRKSN